MYWNIKISRGGADQLDSYVGLKWYTKGFKLTHCLNKHKLLFVFFFLLLLWQYTFKTSFTLIYFCDKKNQ